MEFLDSLFKHVLNAEPFLRLSTGETELYHQIFTIKDEEVKVPEIKHLLEESFDLSGISLMQPPEVLMLVLPRWGYVIHNNTTLAPACSFRVYILIIFLRYDRNTSLYEGVIPNPWLDIAKIINGSKPCER